MVPVPERDQIPAKTPNSAQEPDSVNKMDSNWEIYMVSPSGLHTCMHSSMNTHTLSHACTQQHNHQASTGLDYYSLLLGPIGVDRKCAA